MHNINEIIKMASSRVTYERQRAACRESYAIRDDLDSYLAQLRKDGFTVIENFYSKEQCKILRDEIDKLHEKHSDIVQVDEHDSDTRLFGAERFSSLIKEFYSNNFLLDVAQNYFSGKIWNSNTLAARVDAKKGNLGSGGGWHRDAHHFQFKAIVYLSDVSINNGPFQIIRGSHHSEQVLKDMITMDIDSQTTRYTNEEVQKVIDQRAEDYKILTAKAGTLVLADVSTIHTGMPIQTDSRYTLFNYYYPSYVDKNSKLKYFGIN